MIGKLQKIEATKELIERIAKDEFSSYAKGDWEKQNKYMKQTYRGIAAEIVEDFNYTVAVFDRINMSCTVEECGYWDVEEFYKE